MEQWWATIEAAFPLDMLLRLTLASVAGALLGWERERRDKPAGLRTHMMVSLGAAAFMILSLDYVATDTQQEALRLDPTRVIAGIIGGVGFLGAGTIIEARGNVHGITTAAGIWVAAAVGTACGMGMYGVAFTSVSLAVMILVVFGWLGRSFFRSRTPERE